MRQAKTLIFLILVLLVLASSALAATQAFSLSWWTVDSGGGVSTSDGYALNASIGQPDAGVLSGNSYTLVGGFLSGAGIIEERIGVFLPLIRR